MPAFLIQPLIYLAVAGVLAFGAHKAWSGFKASISAPAVAAQIAKDQPVIDAANARATAADTERDHAKEDTKACVDASKGQSAAIADANKRATDAQNATKAILAAAKLDAKVRQQRIESLQSIASAVPKKDMKCEEELGKAKAILQETLRNRRPVPPAIGPVAPRDALGLPGAK